MIAILCFGVLIGVVICCLVFGLVFIADDWSDWNR